MAYPFAPCWPGPADSRDQTEAMHFVYGKFAWSLNGKDDSTDAKKVSGGATLDQPFDYAAVSDLYFAAAFLPDIPARTTVVTLHNAIELPTNPSDPNSQKKPADVIGLAMGDTSGSTRVRIFAGPKETDLLKSIHSTYGTRSAAAASRSVKGYRQNAHLVATAAASIKWAVDCSLHHQSSDFSSSPRLRRGTWLEQRHQGKVED